tara:strand:- start:7024 stop:7203 length:180 start_codon:yes stop_codon:yes gene_type:complete
MNNRLIGWILFLVPTLVGIEETIRVPNGTRIEWMWITGIVIMIVGFVILMMDYNKTMEE